MKRSVLSAVLLSIALLPAAGIAQPQGMQRLANAPAVPIVGPDGRHRPHFDGHRSIGYHGNHGRAPGTTCAAGLTITSYGPCVRLTSR